MTKKTEKLCEACGSRNMKTHPTTYPMKMGEKQINIQRVWAQECMDCNAMTPTKAGQAKIIRGTSFMASFLFADL